VWQRAGKRDDVGEARRPCRLGQPGALGAVADDAAGEVEPLVAQDATRGDELREALAFLALADGQDDRLRVVGTRLRRVRPQVEAVRDDRDLRRDVRTHERREVRLVVRGAGEHLARFPNFLRKEHGVDVDVGTGVDRQAVGKVEELRGDERDRRRPIGEVGVQLVEPATAHERRRVHAFAEVQDRLSAGPQARVWSRDEAGQHGHVGVRTPLREAQMGAHQCEPCDRKQVSHVAL
jgi:hypothetical protein